jgi:hypothetical protein
MIALVIASSCATYLEAVVARGKSMNTPAHLIFGLTAFGQAARPAVTWAAIAGAIIPDLSLYLMAGTHLMVLGTDPDVVFGQLYYSQAWQSIFRIDNSMVLWGIALVLGVMAKSQVVIALCGAALLHLLFDFGLHHNDGRAHFWPISSWIFESPISYWDRQHYGQIVGPIEIIASMMCCVVLWRRFVGKWMRGFIAALAILEAAPGIVFAIVFA